MRLLLVEDNVKLGSTICKLLTYEKYIVDWAQNGAEAIQLIKENRRNTYDILILDWMLPEFSGIEICQFARKYNYEGGIIFLTAKGSLNDCIKGLEVGADDYITKPFEIKELIARMNALSRRKTKPFIDNLIEKHNIIIDTNIKKAFYNKIDLKLSNKEFEIFEILFIHLNQTILRTSIFEKIWIDKLDTAESSLDTHIYTLRKKIKAVTDNISISLNKGVGYSMEITNDK